MGNNNDSIQRTITRRTKCVIKKYEILFNDFKTNQTKNLSGISANGWGNCLNDPESEYNKKNLYFGQNSVMKTLKP